MRKLISLFLLAVVVLAVSCGKNDAPVQECTLTDRPVTVPESEIQAVEAYLSAKNITNAVKDSRGFYYTIDAIGTGTVTPTVCSRIAVNYVGKLTNDSIFDQTTGNPATFYLGEVIPGWIKGVPLVKSGGSITLYLPPSLGYGSAAVGPIPANSILIFDIDLLGVSLQ